MTSLFVFISFMGEQPPTGFDEVALPVPSEHPPDDKAPDCLAYYFATLYDRGRRIHLYPAYMVDEISFFSLQLVHRGLSAASEKENHTLHLIEKYNIEKSCNATFENYGYEHKLNHSQASCNATFTLTNVVPMNQKLNNGEWNRHETTIKEMMKNKCEKMYVITGAVPGTKKLKNRVYVPSFIWSAYCCINNAAQKMQSGGVIVTNDAKEDGLFTKYGCFILFCKIIESNNISMFNLF
uniref:Uncharacterized protein n=1 Tax=Erpetoichthys calabaricus TaxID=27687 RepID=A0A8C4X5B4_ERPCA